MTDKQESARIVAQECFWGDYLVDSKDILEQIEKNDTAFYRFLFSKIVENSRYPSRHLRALFTKNSLHCLLEDYSARCRNKKLYSTQDEVLRTVFSVSTNFYLTGDTTHLSRLT